MAKYGVSLKIDVSKIDKDRLFRGQKGTYLDATVFIDVDEQDQYGNNGMVTQSWKDQQKGEGAILGNAKVFWRDGGAPSQNRSTAQPQGPAPGPDGFDEDNIPFAPLDSRLA